MAGKQTTTIVLDELFRMVAREKLAVALLAERRAHLEPLTANLDATGMRLEIGKRVRRASGVTTGAGMVAVNAGASTTTERVSASARPSCRPMLKSPKAT